MLRRAGRPAKDTGATAHLGGKAGSRASQSPGRRQGRLGGGTALLVLLFITIGASCAATPLCHKVLRGSQSCRSLETFFLRANVYMYKSVQLNQRVKWKS